MKLKSLLTLAAASLTLSALAAPKITFVSNTFNAPSGVVSMNFDHTISNDIASPQNLFGSVALMFEVDTRYVDMEFKTSTGTKLLSSVTNATNNATFSLSTVSGFSLSSALTGGIGSGSIQQLDATRYQLSFGLTRSSAVYGPSVSNAFLSNSATPIKLLVNTAAIRALPTHSYQITPRGNSTIMVGNNTANRQTIALAQAGGTFAVVPEPGSICAALMGVSGLLIKRKRRA